MRTLLLGEALLDLVSDRPAAGPAGVSAFLPRPGGTGATTATVAAARGARVALAGGAGDDAWGHWLRDDLAAAGVDLGHFVLVRGLRTPVALVRTDPDGVRHADVRGTAVGAALVALGERVVDAVDESDALCLSSQTLVGGAERELTLAARDRALELGLPVVVDPALRPGRWANRARAQTEARGLVRGAFLVRADRADARLLTGEDDPVAAADALLAGGAEHVVIAEGPGGGALLRGSGLHVRVPAAPGRGEPVDATGWGDVLTGVLLAALAQSGFYPSVLAGALRDALVLGERVAGGHGADAWRWTTWTYALERPARPVAPRGPRPGGLDVAVLRDPGLNRELYLRIGHDHGWTDRLGWGPDAWTRWSRRVETHVATLRGAVAGFAELEGRADGTQHLALLGVVEGARGAGVGAHLLHHALRRALERADRVWLTTCSLDHPLARPNYEARGLRLEGERVGPASS